MRQILRESGSTAKRFHLAAGLGALLVLCGLGFGVIGLDTVIMMGIFGRNAVGYLLGFVFVAATWLSIWFGFRLIQSRSGERF